MATTLGILAPALLFLLIALALTLFIFTLLMPFFVYRIRCEVIRLNKTLEGMAQYQQKLLFHVKAARKEVRTMQGAPPDDTE